MRGGKAPSDYIDLNSAPRSADASEMDLPPVALAATIAVTAFALLASLYVMAARFLYEIALHDLKHEAQRLRTEYTRRLEALRQAGGLESDVDILAGAEIGVDILPEAGEPIAEAA